MSVLCIYCFNIPPDPTLLGGRNTNPKEANRGHNKKEMKKKPRSKEVQ